MSARPQSVYGDPFSSLPSSSTPASSTVGSHSAFVTIPITSNDQLSPQHEHSNPFATPAPPSSHSRSLSLLPTHSHSHSQSQYASHSPSRSSYRHSTVLEAGTFNPSHSPVDPFASPVHFAHSLVSPSSSQLPLPFSPSHRQTRSVGRAPSLSHSTRHRNPSISSTHSTQSTTLVPLLPSSSSHSDSRSALSLQQGHRPMAYSPSSQSTDSHTDHMMASFSNALPASATGGAQAGGGASTASSHFNPNAAHAMRRGFSYDGASTLGGAAGGAGQQGPGGGRPPPLQTTSLLPGSFTSPPTASSSRGLYSPMTGITPASGTSPRLPPPASPNLHTASQPGGGGAPGLRAYSPSHYAAASGPSSATSIPPPPQSSSAWRTSQSHVSLSQPAQAAAAPPASSFYPQHLASAFASTSTSTTPGGESSGGSSLNLGSLSQSASPQPPFALRGEGTSTPAHHPQAQQYYQSQQYLGAGGSAALAHGHSHSQGSGAGHAHHASGSGSAAAAARGQPSSSSSFFPTSPNPAGGGPPGSSSGGSADLRNLSLSSSTQVPTLGSLSSGGGGGGAGGRRKKGLRRVRDAREIERGGTVTEGTGGQPRGRRADPSGGWVSPLKALTTSLPSTYALVNPSFHYETSRNPRRVLTKPSKPAQNDGFDNEDSDYILYVNDVLGPEDKDRYLILDVLGQGTFGQVVKCQNMKTHEIVAVKVVKNKPAYFQQSMMEVTILELINNQWDKDDEHHMLRLKDTFIHHSHLCLVFELLSNNLYELIKQNSFRGLSTSLVRVFTAQLLDALSVLNEAKIIHCDLKPENILLKSLQSPTIKVIDFGSACHEKQTVYTYIQSRFYRSPEVILSLPYSAMIDMWSLGCICVELFLGLPLFPGTSEYNQITRIVEMLGPPPDHMLDKGKQTSHFFETVADEYGRRRYRLKSLERYAQEYKANEQPSKKYFSATTLPDIVKQYPIVRKGLKEAEVDKEMRNRIAFIDFVQGLLHLDPEQRWTPQQARLHPFILGEPLVAPFVPPPRHVAAASAKAGSPTVANAAGTTSPSASSSAAAAQQRPYGGLPAAPGSGQPRRTYDAKSYQQHLNQQQGYALAQQQQQQASRAPTNPYALDVAQAQAQAQAHAQAQAQAQAQAAAQAQAHAHAQAQAQAQAQAVYAAQARQAAAQPSLYAGGFAPRSAPVPSGSAGVGVTNPPAVHHHYGQGRQRSGTHGQQNAPLPPALQKLGHELMAGGAGQSVTPVLRRDDQWQAWEQQYAGGNGLQRRISITTRNPHLNLLQEQAESGLNSWHSPARQKPPPPSAAAAAVYGSPNLGAGAGYHYASPLAPSQAQFASAAGDLFDPTGGLAAPPLAYSGGGAASGGGGAGSARYAPYSTPASSLGGGAPAPPPGAAAPQSSAAAMDASFDALHAGGVASAPADPLGHYQPLQPFSSPNPGRGQAQGMYSPNVPQGQGGPPKGLW
ncbi:hypothetical protein JCM10207_004316 [Rhodosporidiobolus poonsookiae]